jgi:uncharacterized protein YxeA
MENKHEVVIVSKPARFASAFFMVRGSILAPFLAVIAASFIAFGIAAIVESKDIVSTVGHYSDQNNYQYMPADITVNKNMKLWSFTADNVVHQQGSKARINFTLDRDLTPPVYLYYNLNHFYQSIQYFHDGRNSEQLAGLKPSSFLFRCDPFKSPGFQDGSGGRVVTVNGGETIAYNAFMYYPCGAAAWSMFNDTFTMYKVTDAAYTMPVVSTDPLNASSVELICNGTDFDAVGNSLGGSSSVNHCRKAGISRHADVSQRFKPVKYSPTSWSSNYPFNASDDYLKNGWYANEAGHRLPDTADLDFQVWMASAPTPNFRKLYRIITTPLTAGTYILEVDEFFDSYSFRGRKGFTLRTAQPWLNEPNQALGVAYIILGGFAMIAAVLVAFKSVYIKRKFNREEEKVMSRQASAVGVESQEQRSAAAAKKRWYTFDIHSENMDRYVELRRQREDIRKWALAQSNRGDEDDADEEDEEYYNDEDAEAAAEAMLLQPDVGTADADAAAGPSSAGQIAPADPPQMSSGLPTPS